VVGDVVEVVYTERPDSLKRVQRKQKISENVRGENKNKGERKLRTIMGWAGTKCTAVRR
jgi:hypothetical protein